MSARSSDPVTREREAPRPIDRRTFLVGSAATLAFAAAPIRPPVAMAEAVPPSRRASRAFAIRHHAARSERSAPREPQPTNGDLERYASGIGTYSKGLSHDSTGIVDRRALDALISALFTGSIAALDSVPLAGVAKLVNPLAAHAYVLEGADPHRLGMPAPPAFDSATQAAEMAELYWQAMTRDVPFEQYGSDASIRAAAEDLSGMPGFEGPRTGGTVTPEVLFRGAARGDLVGPYVSQFLYKTIPYGAMSMQQRCRVPLSGVDFLTTPQDLLSVLNGAPPTSVIRYDETAQHITTGRALGEYVHRDYTYQAFLDAAQILLALGPSGFDRGDPYLRSKVQSGFVTFGGPHILDLVARVADHALKASWYHKWLVHMRLRPESFAFHVNVHLTGAGERPIHEDLIESAALAAVHDAMGTYLLPSAYPEGSPLHPAYPAGHAAIAGACSTVLKAFFDETATVSDPVVPAPDGTSLVPYRGPALTVGGELDKLASNITLARSTAGVHWRSDGIEGIRLGEKVALAVLRDQRSTYAERFDGWSLTTYDGDTMRV